MNRTGFRRKELTHQPPSVARRLERPVVLADCSTMSQPVAKDPPHKNPNTLALAKGKPCLIRSRLCNFDTETTVACHGGGVANGKGMGYKVSDAFTVWGCSACNYFTDAFGGATKAEKAEAISAALPAQRDEMEAIATSKQSSPKDRAAARWWLDNQPQTEEAA
jgi:hypothetical protein